MATKYYLHSWYTSQKASLDNAMKIFLATSTEASMIIQTHNQLVKHSISKLFLRAKNHWGDLLLNSAPNGWTGPQLLGTLTGCYRSFTSQASASLRKRVLNTSFIKLG
jgi:hypothetical protein